SPTEPRSDAPRVGAGSFGGADHCNQTTATGIHGQKISKKKSRHFVIPEILIDEVLELDPADLPQGSVKIGSEVTYKLKCTPARLSAKKIIRNKYLLPADPADKGLKSKIVISPLESNVIRNCMADASLLATLVVEKYAFHMPVYRQMQRFEQAGVKLAHSTMLDWVARAANLLKPLYDHIRTE